MKPVRAGVSAPQPSQAVCALSWVDKQLIAQRLYATTVDSSFLTRSFPCVNYEFAFFKQFFSVIIKNFELTIELNVYF